MGHPVVTILLPILFIYVMLELYNEFLCHSPMPRIGQQICVSGSVVVCKPILVSILAEAEQNDNLIPVTNEVLKYQKSWWP